ncbi:sensor histidine kinase [Phenylobacterium deserti]|nr:HWE histidine kinase domain-containing protein [Phenylobacterium deserti]
MQLPLRRWLLLMSGAALAPVLVLTVVLLLARYQESAARFEADLVSRTRGLALEGESLLSQDSARLEALSVRRTLQSGDFRGFEAELRDAARGAPGWFVLLAEDQGQVINTRLPPGGALPPAGGFPQSAWQELQAGRTRISGVTLGKLSAEPIVAIDTPAVIGSKLYALSYIQPARRFVPFIRAKVREPGRIAVILDQQGRIVARSANAERTIGGSATPDLTRAVRVRSEGVIRSRTLEGLPSILAFSRAPSGWTFVVAAPQSELTTAAWQGVAVAAAQLLLLLATALGATAFFSRRIARDLQNLEAAAAALGEGQQVRERSTGLAETQRVHDALTSASARLLRHDAEQKQALERQSTLVNELNHRVKNTLATVQALARQARKEAAGEASLDGFEHRLMALARAHDLLTANSWQSTDLRDLARSVLAPHRGISFSGPSFALSSYAAVSLVLVLHELATNAAKYGALASGGRVVLEWAVDHARPSLDATWTESGLTKPEPTGAEGFGSRLIRASIERELQGSLERTWGERGVTYRFRLPLTERLTGHAGVPEVSTRASGAGPIPNGR